MLPPTGHLPNQTAEPTEADAAAIFRGCTGQDPIRIGRFPTGLAHYVFDVDSSIGSKVVRIASSRGVGAFRNAINWSKRLRPLGAPLPALLHAGSHNGFDYMVLERLPGSDLCDVYRSLSPEQKREIVAGVVRAQACVRKLGNGLGYGYVCSLDDPFPHPTWRGVIMENVERSRARINVTRVVDVAVADRIERRLDDIDGYLRAVAPQPFLDDTTTKNVICDGGRLSGIVDVDEVCFGDALFTPALTRAALLADGLTPDYTNYWLEQLDPDDQELIAFHIYTAVFCLDLISEAGQKFNRGAAAPIDAMRLRRLSTAIDDCLHKNP